MVYFKVVQLRSLLIIGCLGKEHLRQLKLVKTRVFRSKKCEFLHIQKGILFGNSEFENDNTYKLAFFQEKIGFI